MSFPIPTDTRIHQYAHLFIVMAWKGTVIRLILCLKTLSHYYNLKRSLSVRSIYHYVIKNAIRTSHAYTCLLFIYFFMISLANTIDFENCIFGCRVMTRLLQILLLYAYHQNNSNGGP